MKKSINYIFLILFSFSSIRAQSQMMENDVWQLIDSVNSHKEFNPKQKKMLLDSLLLARTLEDNLRFDLEVQRLRDLANTWDMLAINKIFTDNSGMSEDDQFTFPYTLASFGKIAFYTILNEPDKIIHYVPSELFKKSEKFYLYIEQLDFISDGYLRSYKKFGTEGFVNLKFDEIERIVNSTRLPRLNKWVEYEGYKVKNLAELKSRLPVIWDLFEPYRDYTDLFTNFWIED